MTDKHLISKKLRRIEDFLREIESATPPDSFDSFSKDVVFKRFVERNIELAVEQMISVCKHLVSGLDLREPETYAECFEIISDAGVIEPDVSDIFKSMARYRNLIVHGYDGVDDTITYGIFTRRLDDFRLFIKAVEKFLDNV